MAGPRYIADHEVGGPAVDLDGLVALFHRPSGTTHILAPPAPQILAVLAGCPLDAGELLERLGSRFELQGGEDAMTARLEELELAGLVSRA
jgi:PqqD family protein of HPr-rel-A system